MNNDVLLVPITVEQPNVESQSDIVVYVPQAHKNKPGIVKEGDGVLVENGVVSLNRQTVEDMIDANKWVSYGFQQNLTNEEKGLARHNIGAGDNDFTGSYYDVTQKPHLKTDNTNSLDTGDEEINHTINLHKVSKTGSFDDLNDVPTDTINFAEAERQKCKNLFNYRDYLNLVSIYDYKDSAGYYTKRIALKPNTTYTLSFPTKEETSPILLLNKTESVNAGGYLDTRKTNDVKTYTTDSTGYLYIGVVGSNDTKVNNLLSTLNLQIEEGSVATNNQKYNGPILHENDLGNFEKSENKTASFSIIDHTKYPSMLGLSYAHQGGLRYGFTGETDDDLLNWVKNEAPVGYYHFYWSHGSVEGVDVMKASSQYATVVKTGYWISSPRYINCLAAGEWSGWKKFLTN